MKQPTYSNNVSKKTIPLVKTLLPILLGVFFIVYAYFQFSAEELDEIKFHFLQADYRFVFLSVILGILVNLSRTIRWGYMIEALGYKTSFHNRLLSVYITYLMNLFIPRSGEVSRAVVLNKYEDVPFTKTLGSIIAERALDFLILLIFIVFAISFQHHLFLNLAQTQLVNSKTLLLAFIFLSLFSIIALLFVFKSKSTLAQKIKDFLKDLKEGVLSIFKLKKKWWFMFHTLLIWGLYVAMFYVMIFTIPQTSMLPISAVLTAFVVGSLTIVFTNGGFGAYPFFIAAVLTFFDIPETAGTTFGWLVWGSQTIMVIILGTLALLLLPLLNKQN